MFLFVHACELLLAFPTQNSELELWWRLWRKPWHGLSICHQLKRWKQTLSWKHSAIWLTVMLTHVTAFKQDSPSLNTPLTVNANKVLYGEGRKTSKCHKNVNYKSRASVITVLKTLRNSLNICWHQHWLNSCHAGSLGAHWGRRLQSGGIVLAGGTERL